MATKKEKINVSKVEAVELPPFPVVKPGQIGMRMIYASGECRDIIQPTMVECVVAAKTQAKSDGFRFHNSAHVIGWANIPRGE